MSRRVVHLQFFVAMALGVLALRLIHLQLIRGGFYRHLAEQNRLRLIPEPAPRGLITDRRGRVLAANQTVFRVTIVPQEVEDYSAVIARVSTLVRRPGEVLTRAYRAERTLPFIPATIVSQVPKDVALQLEEARWRLPGLLVKPETVRHYPLGASAAHLLGHLSQPTAEEMPLLKQYGVHPKQLVGRTGIERVFDDVLRGRGGGLLVEVNNRGQEVRVIGRREPEAGARVVLTIDAQLQSLIEQTFGTQAGACVVLDPATGAVLAMASLPAFSPEVFVLPDVGSIRRLLNDAESPLMNRAAVGVYQPGSIAKLVTTAAALEHQLITPTTTMVCPGSITIGDRTFHCWNRDGHGSLTLPEALMQSCNVYFMQTGRKVGLARLRAMMEKVGFSRRTGWLLEEQRGHLPQRRLTEGEVALLAIGQGEVELTVLQAAVMASAFANHGWIVEPWVVTAVAERPIGHPALRRRLGWSNSTLEAVREGMRLVVNDPAGTGHRAFSPHISIAGKTGTAQTHVPGRPHGWFVGFCPIEQPRVAMAIVAEHGGSGGDLPAEIARTICEYVSAPETL